MKRVRYLLDEHVDPLVQRELRRRASELIVLRMGEPDAPRLGTPDTEILTWCENNEFLLVTNNRHSMPVHLREHLESGRHATGVLLVQRGSGLGDAITQLALIWETCTLDEFADRITYLPVA